MSADEEKQYVDTFISKYLDTFLSNLQQILNAELKFTVPYAILITSAIDFLGGLEMGFRDDDGRQNSGQRFTNFVRTWMAQANTLYGEPLMAELLYDLVRNGAVHQIIYKRGVEVYVGRDNSELHLNIRDKGGEKIFFHIYAFIEDFKKAQEIFRSEFIAKNYPIVYKNLKKVIEIDRAETYKKLFDSLKEKSKIFFDDVEPSPSAPPPGSN